VLASGAGDQHSPTAVGHGHGDRPFVPIAGSVDFSFGSNERVSQQVEKLNTHAFIYLGGTYNALQRLASHLQSSGSQLGVCAKTRSAEGGFFVA
jgi:hypothetical protein